MTPPEFPIRILFDDGECLVIESPEHLLEAVDTIDSGDPRVWVRDALDRDVTLRMRGGFVEVIGSEARSAEGSGT
ncbi:MAG TPA: hypothetical protein VNL91_08565 [Thermoanaerobaculia bacterium]|nr:hypothetical protein [Thermoanaerobaculia bacterium]